jgi:pyruvate carboxylase subunit B
MTGDMELLKAPLPGVVVRIFKKEGDTVKVGDVLMILEAMKMESELAAPHDGIVERILVNERDVVSEGQDLSRLNRNN